MKHKKCRLKLAAAVMTAVMGFQMTAQPLQASAASTQYLSEVILSYGKTDEEAKSWLTQNGYKVVGQNLNEGGEGGSDAFSWMGLASEKRSVFLGYKTTTNPEEAITDMKIMNMNGGYSYEAYEKVLADTKAEKEHFLENIMAALKEYRANYKAGKTKAKIAHDNLNKFKDDDSGALMGDLLLNTLKTEDEAAWEADKTQHADMVTILMQGNSTCVSEIMQNLAFAADTADDSFVNRAIAAADSNKNAFDTFFEDFMKKHPDYTKDEAVTELMQLYDDDAKMFASSLIGLRNYLSNYTQSTLAIDSMKKEIDAYFAAHEFEDESLWTSAANAYTLLTGVRYGDATLATYLVYTDDDYLDNSALLSGYDAIGLPQRAKLYPLIAQMSQGQRCLLEYTAMDRMLTMGLMDEDTWKSTYATMQDAAFGADKIEPCSVYAEVNRNDFQVGEIAVTNAAQGKAASLGEEVNEGLFGVGISYLTAGIGVGGLVTSIAGIAIAAKNWGAGAAVQQAVQQGKSLVAGVESNLIDVFNKPVQMTPVTAASVDDLVQKISEHNDILKKNIDNLARFARMSGGSKSLVESAATRAIRTNNIKLTFAGPNTEITFNAGARIDYDGQGNVVSVTNCDGTVYKVDGSVSVDKAVKQQYDNFMKQVNPDFKKAANQAKEQLDDLAAAAGQNVDEAVQTAKSTFDEALAHGDLGSAYKDWLIYKKLPADTSIYDLTDDQFKEVVACANGEIQLDDYDTYGGNYDVNKLRDQRNLLKADQANKDGWEIVDKMDDIADGGQDAADKANDAADAAMTSGSGSTFWKWFGVGMAIVGLIMSAYSVYAAISEMKEYYHQEMLPIPRKMVDLGYYDDGSTCYIYYDCAKCNRTAMNMGNETLGDYGDLNGDVMKQWLALYTTKDTRAGKPILASITVKKGTTSMPMKTVPLSFFGFNSAVNMTDTKYTYNDAKNGIYLYYKQAAASAYAGSVASAGTLAATGVLSALGGAGICGLIAALVSKRKKKPEEATTAA